jgi:hypothetical protein
MKSQAIEVKTVFSGAGSLLYPKPRLLQRQKDTLMTSPVTSAPSSPRHSAASSQQPAASHVDPSLKRPASPASHELEGLSKRLATGLKFSAATSFPPRSSVPSAAAASSHKRAAPDSDVSESSVKRAHTHSEPAALPVEVKLLDLPKELQTRVAQQLSTSRDLLNLSLTSRELKGAAAAPLLLKQKLKELTERAVTVATATLHVGPAEEPTNTPFAMFLKDLQQTLPSNLWAEPLTTLIESDTTSLDKTTTAIAMFCSEQHDGHNNFEAPGISKVLALCLKQAFFDRNSYPVDLQTLEANVQSEVAAFKMRRDSSDVNAANPTLMWGLALMEAAENTRQNNAGQ